MSVIRIIQLYPRDMNLYGDWGNVLVLKKRLEWRGHEVEIIDHNPGDETDFSSGDIFVGGGGQDAGQAVIQGDLLAHGEELARLVEDGVPMLMICGMYQMFGRRFLTKDGQEIKGVGALPLETIAGDERLIGNISLESEEFGRVVGYENHSGQTYLDRCDIKPLGKVIRGAGNNSEGEYEGAHYKNVIATYLHGPILPKNPKLADYLIAEALKRRGLDDKLTELEIDHLAQTTQTTAANRPR